MKLKTKSKGMKGDQLAKIYAEKSTLQLRTEIDSLIEKRRVEPYLDGFYSDQIFFMKRELLKRGEEI